MEAEEQFMQLDLSNAFLFSLAFSDPEACALVLQVILQKPAYKVMVQPEKSILYSKEFRSVRLDVYARDPPGGRAEGADPFFAVPGELHRRVRAEHAGRDRGKAS